MLYQYLCDLIIQMYTVVLPCVTSFNQCGESLWSLRAAAADSCTQHQWWVGTAGHACQHASRQSIYQTFIADRHETLCDHCCIPAACQQQPAVNSEGFCSRTAAVIMFCRLHLSPLLWAHHDHWVATRRKQSGNRIRTSWASISYGTIYLVS